MLIKPRIIHIVALVLILFGCNTEKETGRVPESSDTRSNALDLYERARMLGDDQTAIVALNELLLQDSSNMRYKDSLARLYLRNGEHEPGLKVGAEVMASDWGNDALLELIAYAHEVTGESDKAIAGFNELYRSSKNISYRYEVAKIKYTIGESSEANVILKELAENNELTEEIEFLAQEGTQKVSIQAAANFLMAQIALDRNQHGTAMNYLRAALASSPDFQQAQYGMQQLQTLMQQQREQRELQELQRKYGGGGGF